MTMEKPEKLGGNQAVSAHRLLYQACRDHELEDLVQCFGPFRNRILEYLYY